MSILPREIGVGACSPITSGSQPGSLCRTVMRQGNDVGTQYRSGIYYYSDAQRQAAERTRDEYQRRLSAARYGSITTEIAEAPEFYYAEDYHQQYLSKNPGGYCGLGGTGVSCPVGLVTK